MARDERRGARVLRDRDERGAATRKAKSRAIDLLGLHFKAKGRTIYLADELSVLYPEERAFEPDVLAVLDVEQPEDDERLAWVVADEGRGIDLALEVLHNGDRRKDLVDNVERYARLGIPEYFVYDRARQRVHGHRLPSPEARRYERIVPRAGRLSSKVLGVDFAVQNGRLCFFDGMAELVGRAELISRLAGMIDSLDSQAEAAQQRAEAAQQRAEAEQEKQRDVVERSRASVLAACEARFGEVPEALRDALVRSDDAARLQSALLEAVTASDARAALEVLNAP